MAEFTGLRISKFGKNVKNAADFDYIFNSDWNSLQIVFDYNYDGSKGLPYTVPHNLGYPPFTLGTATFTFDSTNIYFQSAGDVKCFKVDLTKNKKNSYLNAQLNYQNYNYDPAFGIKISKYGKNINSTDLRDFILHSKGQTMGVTQVATKITNTGAKDYVEIANPYSYIPYSFGFYKSSDIWNVAPLGSNETYSYTPVLYYNPTGVGVVDFSGISQQLTVVMLRDPYTTLNTTSVTY